MFKFHGVEKRWELHYFVDCSGKVFTTTAIVLKLQGGPAERQNEVCVIEMVHPSRIRDIL